MRTLRATTERRGRSGRLSAALCLLLSALSFLGAVAVASSLLGAKQGGTVPQATPNVVPLPVDSSLDPRNHLELSAETVIYVPEPEGETGQIASKLAELLGDLGAPEPPVRALGGASPLGAIVLTKKGAESELGLEGYEIEISQERMVIRAAAAAGLFYAVQTLRQMLPAEPNADPGTAETLRLPSGTIEDRPRFEWRGAMLDVARHFRTVDEVKRYIDLMSLYKLNRLHLHLTDDQGWRIEIRSWPRLAEIGGRSEVGGGPGGYYSQAEYAEIVSYAAERYVTVIPEIDMPGHTNAALAAVPELNCNGIAPPAYTGTDVGFSSLCLGKELTYTFIDNVIGEVAALTPGPYIHFGGDEAQTISQTEHAAFVRRVQGIIRRHGKQPIGWDEIAISSGAGGHAPEPSAIVQWWQPRDHAREAVTAHAARGGSVILSPADRFYLDMKYEESTEIGHTWAGITSTRHAYAGNPAELLPQLPADAILGVEAALWSETTETMADVEHLLFPRLPGIAELAWSPAAALSWSNYRARLADHAPLWHALGINYYRSPEIPWSQ